MFQEAFHRATVSNDAAVDAPDAFFPKEGFPFPEEGIGLEGDGGILRADGRVSPAQDVQVSVQGSVFLKDAGVSQAGLEAEICSQSVQGHAGGDELAVGGGHQAHSRVVAGQHLAGGVPGVNPPGRALEGFLGGGYINVFLGRCLAPQGRSGK